MTPSYMYTSEKDPLQRARPFYSKHRHIALSFGVLFGSVRAASLLTTLGILQEFPLSCQRESDGL